MVWSSHISVQLYNAILFLSTGSVNENNSFFIYEEDAPISTKVPGYVPLFVTPVVDEATEALIEETCGDNSECAYDIAVTGNVDVGRETLVEIEEHMMIVNLTLPSMITGSSYVYTH